MKRTSKLLLILTAFLIFPSFTRAAFVDVSSNHPYFEAINYLQENDIVEGYSDGSYRPDQQVNRAEALKIILLGSDILVPEISEQDIFPDVIYDTWYAKYAAKAKNLSIVHGDGDTGMFRPGDTINLAEILKILLETNNIELRTEEDMERRPYADVPTDAWFAPYFDYADSIHLLPEDDDYNVFPATPVTRGLMAQLIYQLEMKPEGYQEGTASYYGEKFHGKTTASGEIFDASQFTCAHRTLPFNSWLKVVNLENGKETYVRVTDRGPYADTENRIIDLSKAAFESISPLSRGIINVSITPVSGPPAEDEIQEPAETPETPESSEPSVSSAVCPEAGNIGFVPKNTFENITLDRDIPDRFLASEVLTLSGTTPSNKGIVSAFLATENGDQYPYYADTDSEGHFTLNVFFPSEGNYQLGILPGDTGSSVIYDLQVLPDSCISQSTGSGSSSSTMDIDVKGGDTVASWEHSGDFELTKVTFTQGGRSKSYIVYGGNELIPNYPDFGDWSIGQVTLAVQGADLETDSLLQADSLNWTPKVTKTFSADRHYEYEIEKDSVSVLSLPDTFTPGSAFTLRIDPQTNIQETGMVIMPDGFVHDVALQSPTHSPIEGPSGDMIYPGTTADLRLTYTPTQSKIYFIEVNDEQNLPVVNIPIYPGSLYPLLPNPVELSVNEPEMEVGSDLNSLRTAMLALVNQDRAEHGIAPVVLDQPLSQLAQYRSEDMVADSYFSHWDMNGNTANDLRTNFAIRQYVSENLSRDTTMELAEYGLMRSASHRANILKKEWKRVGFGFTKDPGNGIIFVQIFSDNPIDLENVGNLRNEILGTINEERGVNLSISEALNVQAQAWTERMAAEGFFDFTAPDSTTFVNTIRESGINETLGTYIVGNSSFESGLEQIMENDQLKEPRWKKMGIGIKQDSFGIIKITLLYTE